VSASVTMETIVVIGTSSALEPVLSWQRRQMPVSAN